MEMLLTVTYRVTISLDLSYELIRHFYNQQDKPILCDLSASDKSDPDYFSLFSRYSNSIEVQTKY